MARKTNLKFTGERLINGIEGFIKLEHLHRYALAMDFVKNKIVLDIACGDGYGSNLMAEKAKYIYAMDIDDTTIEYAKFTYRKTNLSFLTGDIRKMPFQNYTFDVVVCFETIEHVDDHDLVLSEIKRILKPNGLLLMSTPDKTNYTAGNNHFNPYHIKELSFKEYTDLLAKYFVSNQYVFQFPSISSIIVTPEISELRYYSGSYSRIENDSRPPTNYIISISSEAQIQMPQSSIFYDKDIKNFLKNANENKIEIKIAKRILKFLQLIKKYGSIFRMKFHN